LYYQTRIRYGSLYVQFRQDKAKFAFIVYGRKLVMAICFGFLATTLISDEDSSVTLFWTQIIIPAVFNLFYIVSLFFVKPYVDIVHAFLDGFLNFLNILTLAVSILFRSDSPSDIDAGLFAVMIFQITGLISVIFAYLYTWMYYAGYNSVAELCGGKKEPEKEETSVSKPTETKDKSEISESSLSDKEEEKKSEKSEKSQKSEKSEKPEVKPARKGGKGKKRKKKQKKQKKLMKRISVIWRFPIRVIYFP